MQLLNALLAEIRDHFPEIRELTRNGILIFDCY